MQPAERWVVKNLLFTKATRPNKQRNFPEVNIIYIFAPKLYFLRRMKKKHFTLSVFKGNDPLYNVSICKRKLFDNLENSCV